MTKQDDEFLAQLLAAFRVEAEEHLQAMSTGLLDLEKAPATDAQLPVLEGVYREAHSLKGAARAVNLPAIEAVCQSIESVFATWRRGDQPRTPAAFDELHRSLDSLRLLLGSPAVPGEPGQPASPMAPGDTIRLATGKLDKVLREAEELLAVKLVIGQRAAELRELAAWYEPWQQHWATLQPDLRVLRQPHEASLAIAELSRLLAFCDWNQQELRALATRMATLAKSVQQDHHDCGRLVDELLDDAKKLVMLPFATMLGILPKLVRDLSRDQGKEVDIVVHGAEAEIDKRILEELKDPLIHLVRNSVDHGVEAPAVRAARGKAARGLITISVTEVDGNKVELVVADDGGGIDADRVREAAVRQGIIAADEARQLDDAAAVALIFHSAVSTSTTVTTISGRGLGLTIVREKVEKLGGRVTVENLPGRGAKFRLLLPVTLATFRGTMIEVAGQVFVIPTTNIARVLSIKPGDIKTVQNRETIVVNARALALARLERVLALTRHGDPPDAQVAVLLVTPEQQIAFLVDAVLNETEVRVQALLPPLVRVRHVAGATILGSGKVVPVLHVMDLMKSAVAAVVPARPQAVPVARKRQTVLVVEDSITSRMLLKSILESAGYRVVTAVDGVDALTALKMETFDAVVSDIEMPRLNGFGLTEKIRGDTKLAALPVVLVTALESAADRERGVDAGANAYLVKSSFDQSNLLEALERLV